ncbi:MAG: rhomboid family intramembrane serine protease [Candidatus Micrarchaeota archaeon]
MKSLNSYLLVFIVAVFLVQLITGLEGGFTTSFWLDPSNFFSEPWRIITSMFLHGSFLHLFFNCFALFMFGPLLENRVGKKNFLAIFLLAGIIGAIAYYATTVIGIIPALPALGASGGIFGVLGALAILYPDLRIFIWFIPMSMKQAAIFWFVLELLGSFNAGSGIGSAAHLGGLIFGLAAGYYFKKKTRIRPPVFN